MRQTLPEGRIEGFTKWDAPGWQGWFVEGGLQLLSWRSPQHLSAEPTSPPMVFLIANFNTSVP